MSHIPLKLAFGHKARVGKDTACEYIDKLFRSKLYRFATPVYDLAALIQNYLGKPNVKDPKLLQTIGVKLREVYHDNIWVDVVMPNIEKDSLYNEQTPGNNTGVQVACVPDMRFKNEMAALKKAGFVTIKINRANRIIDRDPNHPSEIDLNNAEFDEVINNDYAPEHLYAILNTIIYNYYSKVDEAFVEKFRYRIVANATIYSDQGESKVTYTTFSSINIEAAFKQFVLLVDANVSNEYQKNKDLNKSIDESIEDYLNETFNMPCGDIMHKITFNRISKYV